MNGMVKPRATAAAGRSAATSARKVGVAAPPDVGPPRNRLADWVASTAVRVPVDVIAAVGVLECTTPSPVYVTEDTEPPDDACQAGLAPAPSVVSRWPDVPGARQVHALADL